MSDGATRFQGPGLGAPTSPGDHWKVVRLHRLGLPLRVEFVDRGVSARFLQRSLVRYCDKIAGRPVRRMAMYYKIPGLYTTPRGQSFVASGSKRSLILSRGQREMSASLWHLLTVGCVGPHVESSLASEVLHTALKRRTSIRNQGDQVLGAL